jgi:hypothetical protein
MWITKLLDVLTLGISYYFRKENEKRKHRFEMEKLKYKDSLDIITKGKKNEKSQ